MANRHIDRSDLASFMEIHGHGHKYLWQWFDTLVATYALNNGAPVELAASIACTEADKYLKNVNKLIDGGYITREAFLSVALMLQTVNTNKDNPPSLRGKYVDLTKEVLRKYLMTLVTSEVTDG